ncbi:MAG: hypothetical protein V3S45_06225 [Kiloniellales bacterium]
MIDRSRAKHLAITVGLTNLCGALPVVAALWSKGQSTSVALEIAGDAFSWLMARLRWVGRFSWFCRSSWRATNAVTTDARLALLRRRQANLIEAWGEEVTGQAEARSPNAGDS